MSPASAEPGPNYIPGPASVSAAVLDVPVLDAQTAAAFLADRTGEAGLVTEAELASFLRALLAED